MVKRNHESDICLRRYLNLKLDYLKVPNYLHAMVCTRAVLKPEITMIYNLAHTTFVSK